MKIFFRFLFPFPVILMIAVFDFPSASGESSLNKSEEAAVYFNAATEIYLQGDYSRTVENLEKAVLLDPKSKQITDFLSRVIVEAGTHYNLTRNYKTAMNFLEKGRTLLPGDKRIEELYLITSDVLRRQKPELQIKKSTAPLSPKDTQATIERTTRPAVPAPTAAPAPTKRVREKPAPPPAITPAPTTEIPARLILLAGMAGAILLIPSVLIILYIKNLKQEIKNFSKNFMKNLESQGEMNEVSDGADPASFHSSNRTAGTGTAGLGTGTAGAVPPPKPVVRVPGPPSFVPEVFFSSEREKLETIVFNNLPSTDNIFISDPKLDQIRDSIAIKCQSLYENSKETAMAFLKKMAGNPDGGIRANIVKGVVVICQPETLDILFSLLNDPDDRVKRETLKGLKILKKQIESGESALSDDYQKKVISLLQDEISSGNWIF